MIRLFFALLALTFAGVAHAANDVALTSEMFIERTVPGAGGNSKFVLEKPRSVPPGAKLVFVLSYRNQGKAAATNFTVTNPMPAGVTFDSATSPGSEVSVDGGKSWGALPSLRVPLGNGTSRPAQSIDVTHVRWVLKAPIPIAGAGKLSFRATVK